jgi:hypothetical protein
MKNELLLKALDQLAKAIDVVAYHAVQGEDKYQVSGLLQEYQSLTAELRADMQLNSSTPPQLNKTDVSGSLPLKSYVDWLTEAEQKAIDIGDKQSKMQELNAAGSSYGAAFAFRQSKEQFMAIVGRQ